MSPKAALNPEPAPAPDALPEDASDAAPVEAWLSIPNYEGLYEVSDLGRVRSLPRRTASGILGGRILSPCSFGAGYLRVTLSRDGIAKRFSVHRLVLLAFVGQPGEGQECCHGDNVTSNNALTNLRWDTRSENAFDRVAAGRHYDNVGSRHPLAKLSPELGKIIFWMRSDGRLLSEIAAATSLSIATISRVVNRKSWLEQANVH